MILNIALYEPEIPPNTGNIIRLCANFGCQLHVIEPLGFVWDDKRLRRAGLDYHEWTSVIKHESFTSFIQANAGRRILAFTTKARQTLPKATFQSGDILLFGPESRGLPLSVLDALPDTMKIRIPMRANSRSLNLSNTVAIAAYAALQQLGFESLNLK